MFDPVTTLALSAAGLTALAMVTAAALMGWRGWLELKRRELDHRREPGPSGSASARIEMADLRERIRKLEAIAAGVEL